MEPIPEQHVPAPGPPIDVDDKVKQALRGTSFEAASLERLSGGSVNWAYRATLSKPLDDGTSSVLVKHGETYMLSKPEFPLTLLRCVRHPQPQQERTAPHLSPRRRGVLG